MKSPIRSVRERSVNEILGRSGISIGRGGAKHQIEQACSKPIGGLQAEELYLLLSHRIAAKYLLPFALECLLADPWQTVAFEQGGLLSAIALTDPAHWPPGHQWRTRLSALLKDALVRAEALFEFERKPKLETKLAEILTSLHSETRPMA